MGEVIDIINGHDPKKAEHLVQRTGGKVVEALRNGDFKKADEELVVGTLEVMHVVDTYEWWTTHWLYLLILLVFIVLSFICCLQILRWICVPKRARSPNLLAESEMAMWVRSDSNVMMGEE